MVHATPGHESSVYYRATDRFGSHVVSSVVVWCSDADRLQSSWAGNTIWKVPSGRRIRCWAHSGPPVRIFNQSVTTTAQQEMRACKFGAWFGADIWLNRDLSYPGVPGGKAKRLTQKVGDDQITLVRPVRNAPSMIKH